MPNLMQTLHTQQAVSSLTSSQNLLLCIISGGAVSGWSDKTRCWWARFSTDHLLPANILSLFNVLLSAFLLLLMTSLLVSLFSSFLHGLKLILHIFFPQLGNITSLYRLRCFKQFLQKKEKVRYERLLVK